MPKTPSISELEREDTRKRLARSKLYKAKVGTALELNTWDDPFSPSFRTNLEKQLYEQEGERPSQQRLDEVVATERKKALEKTQLAKDIYGKKVKEGLFSSPEEMTLSPEQKESISKNTPFRKTFEQTWGGEEVADAVGSLVAKKYTTRAHVDAAKSFFKTIYDNLGFADRPEEAIDFALDMHREQFDALREKQKRMVLEEYKGRPLSKQDLDEIQDKLPFSENELRTLGETFGTEAVRKELSLREKYPGGIPGKIYKALDVEIEVPFGFAGGALKELKATQSAGEAANRTTIMGISPTMFFKQLVEDPMGAAQTYKKMVTTGVDEANRRWWKEEDGLGLSGYLASLNQEKIDKASKEADAFLQNQPFKDDAERQIAKDKFVSERVSQLNKDELFSLAEKHPYLLEFVGSLAAPSPIAASIGKVANMPSAKRLVDKAMGSKGMEVFREYFVHRGELPYNLPQTLKDELKLAEMHGLFEEQSWRSAIESSLSKIPPLTEEESTLVSRALNPTASGHENALYNVVNNSKLKAAYDNFSNLSAEVAKARVDRVGGYHARKFNEKGFLEEVQTRREYGHPQEVRLNQDENSFGLSRRDRSRIEAQSAKAREVGAGYIEDPLLQWEAAARSQSRAAGISRELAGVGETLKKHDLYAEFSGKELQDLVSQDPLYRKAANDLEKSLVSWNREERTVAENKLALLKQVAVDRVVKSKIYTLKEETGLDFVRLKQVYGGADIKGDFLKAVTSSDDLKAGKNINETEILVPAFLTKRLEEMYPRPTKESAEAARFMLGVSRSIGSLWKVSSTLMVPAYYMTNATSAFQWSLVQKGLRGANPRTQSAALYTAIASALSKSDEALKIGYKLPDGKIHQLSELLAWAREDMIVGSGQELYSSFKKTGGDWTQFLPNTTQKLTDTVTTYTGAKAINGIIDDYQHFVSYLGNLTDGSLEDRARAAQKAAEYTGNYFRLSKFQRGMKDVLGFYYWNSHAIPATIRSLVQHPSRIMNWERLARAQNLQHLREVPEGGEPTEVLPELYRDPSYMVAAKKYQRPEKLGPNSFVAERFVTTPFDTLNKALGDPLKFFAGNMGLASTAIVEELTGTELYSGNPIPENQRLKRLALKPIQRPWDAYGNLIRTLIDQQKYDEAITLAMEFKVMNDFPILGGLALGKGLQNPLVRKQVVKPDYFGPTNLYEKAKENMRYSKP